MYAFVWLGRLSILEKDKKLNPIRPQHVLIKFRNNSSRGEYKNNYINKYYFFVAGVIMNNVSQILTNDRALNIKYFYDDDDVLNWIYC